MVKTRLEQIATEKTRIVNIGQLDTSQFQSIEIPTLEITTEALWKLDTHAEIVRTLASGEVYGYLVTPQNSLDKVIRDVYLSQRQLVNSVHAGVDQEGVLLSAEDIRQHGNRIMGWWHSHKGVGLGIILEKMMKILEC